MAAWVPNMFCNFQFMKNHRNGNNSMMTHKASFVLVLPMKWEQPNTLYKQICISNDNQTIGEEGFYMKRKGEEREQTDGETERERACVCVCVLVDAKDSVSQHPQTTWDRETHLAIIDGLHLWSISGDVLGTIRNDVSHGWPDVWLRYLNRRQFKKGRPIWH
jgi:hypothetical protein